MAKREGQEMNCNKCSGLLVATEFHDIIVGASIYMARCLSCGNVFDETMILNRKNPPSRKVKHCKIREYGVRV